MTWEGVQPGALSPAHATLQRGRKPRKDSAGDNGVTHRGVLRGPCQELQPVHRLSGTQQDRRLGARCARTRTCATADPSGAQDKGSAFDRGKDVDSLQSTG